MKRGLGLLLLAGILLFAEEVPEALLDLEEVFAAQEELIERRYLSEVENLRTLYVGSIRSLADRAVSAGDLDRVLLLRELAERFEEEQPEPVGPPLSQDAEFVRLQETWVSVYGELRARRDEQMQQLLRQVRESMTALQRRLTQEGDLDAALQVQRRLRALPEAGDPPPAPNRQAEDREASGPPIPEWELQQFFSQIASSVVLHLSFDRVDQARRLTDRSRNRHRVETQDVEIVPDGKVGSAIRFNGRTSDATVPHHPALQTGGDMTLAFWINPSRLEMRQNPIQKTYGGEFAITLEPDGQVHFYHGSSGRDLAPYQGVLLTRPLAVDTWTHLMVVRDMTARRVIWYVNGIRRDEAEITLPRISVSERPIRLGRGYAGRFAGRMDELILLNRALNDADARRLFQFSGGR